MKSPAPKPLPRFASAPWYLDPSTSRCPHDAWLESVEIRETATGRRRQNRKTSIVLRLLASWHDGHIVLRYTGVTRYRLLAADSGRGSGDWATDQFSHAPNGHLRHLITWHGSGGEKGAGWDIVAERVTYEWVPRGQAKRTARSRAG